MLFLVSGHGCRAIVRAGCWALQVKMVSCRASCSSWPSAPHTGQDSLVPIPFIYICFISCTSICSIPLHPLVLMKMHIQLQFRGFWRKRSKPVFAPSPRPPWHPVARLPHCSPIQLKSHICCRGSFMHCCNTTVRSNVSITQNGSYVSKVR